MVSAPLVAIPAYHLAPGRVARWESGTFAVPDPYVDALRRAGLRPVLVPAPGDAPPEEILEPFDGLVLIGGGDVEPSRYGAEPNAELYGLEPERDELEIGLLHAADRMDVPTLAICRGTQVLNVAFGGTLIQHLPDVEGLVAHGVPAGGAPITHDVKAEPGSRLAEACGDGPLACSSHHHQGLDRLGDGLVPVAWTEDGLVEGVERGRGWMVGVQWHPEDTADRDPAQQALFDAFGERVRGART